ncbi:MAG TPA: hypothetical protein VE664_04105 [Actinomycetes bacterium]|nr:hypothetical protein [Actinomycetes bacterium]
MPEDRAVIPPKPIRRRRVPIGFQVLLAAGGLLSLLAISMVVAIVLVMNLDRDRTHQSGRGLRYVNAVVASMGADRALRTSYEQTLARAQSMGARSMESARTSDAAASSRSVRILLACFLVALAIGSAMAVWLVRSIAMPVSRLMAVLRVDMPSRGSA